MYLNYLANYVPNAWNYEHGCSHCDDDVVDFSQLKVGAPDCFFPSTCHPFLVCFEIAAVESSSSASLLDSGKDDTYSPFPNINHPCITDCLDSSWRSQIFSRISTDKQFCWYSTVFPAIIGYVPIPHFWTILKEHKCKGNYLGMRKHCTSAVQDMAFEVFWRAHLKGCHCRPGCLLACAALWVLSTIVTYSGCTENLSQSSTQAGNI